MEHERIKLSQVSSTPAAQPVKESRGRFIGRFVKSDRGKKIIGFFTLVLDYIPGSRLLDRTIKTIIENTKTKDMQGIFWDVAPLPEKPRDMRAVLVASALAQVPYTLNTNEKETWEIVREAEIFGEIPVNEDDPDLLFPESPHYNVEKNCFYDLIKAQASIEKKQSKEVDDESGFAEMLAKDPLFKNASVLESGMFVDPKSGLTAVLVKDERTGKLTLIFGGTLSGMGSGTQKKMDGSRFKGKGRTWAQINANFQNFTGLGIPRCYLQAAKLAEFVMAKMNDGSMKLDDKWTYPGDPLVLTGHSLGGALVQYTAAKTGLPGTGFSSAALGRKTLNSLSKEQKMRAKTGLVTNYLIENDPVNTPLGYKVFHKEFTPTVIGKRSIIKGQAATGQNTLYGRHSFSHMHYDHEFRKNCNQGG